MTRLDTSKWTEAEQRIQAALDELAALEPLIHAETLSPNVARFIREVQTLALAYEQGLDVLVGMVEVSMDNLKELCEGDGA